MSKAKSISIDSVDNGPGAVLAHVADAMTAAVSSKSDAAQTSPMLVLVHGTHCGHCIEFKKDWRRLSRRLNSQAQMNTLAMESGVVDEVSRASSSSQPLLHKAHVLVGQLSKDVSAVPYIAMWFPNGETRKFDQERTLKNLVFFVRDEMKLHSKKVLP
jgi:hypothetical protein